MAQLINWLNKFNKETPHNKAVIYREMESNDYCNISYSELYKYVLSVSGFLSEYKNKTIAIIGNNKLEYLVSLLSIICNIGDAFLIDKELYEPDIIKLLHKVNVDLIILDDDLDLVLKGYKVIKFSQIKDNYNKKYDFLVDKSFSGKLILHTSGTTGEPKCIALDEEKYLSTILELNKKWKVTSDQSCLLIIPLYHIYALTSLFHGIYAGITNILEWDYKRINDVLTKTKPHLFMGVPLMYNKIMNSVMSKNGTKIKIAIVLSKILLFFKIDIRKALFKDIHNYFGGNYIFGCSAGSLLSSKTSSFFNNIGLPLYNVYGMTETSGPIAINYKNNINYDSVGKILDANKIKIINQNNNGIGEIYVKGENVFNGYIGDKKKPYMLSDYFDTGDIGYVKDGYLFVVGRKKNILVGDNGKNISPEELNNKILKYKKIYDCNIVMEKNKLIAIINTDLPEKRISEIINNVNKTLPKYKRISRYKITNKKIK